MPESTERVSVKLFIGCVLTSEIRMHLNASLDWKEAKIDQIELIEAHFEGKHYFGQYTTAPNLTLAGLKQIQLEIQKALKVYCPKLEKENHNFSVFPQLFVQ